MPMDRKQIARELQSAEERARIGAEQVQSQRHVLVALEADGHDTKMARELLRTFEGIHEMQHAECLRLSKELRDAKGKK